jgi:hypothetical protein
MINREDAERIASIITTTKYGGVPSVGSAVLENSVWIVSLRILLHGICCHKVFESYLLCLGIAGKIEISDTDGHVIYMTPRAEVTKLRRDRLDSIRLKSCEILEKIDHKKLQSRRLPDFMYKNVENVLHDMFKNYAFNLDNTSVYSDSSMGSIEELAWTLNYLESSKVLTRTKDIDDEIIYIPDNILVVLANNSDSIEDAIAKTISALELGENLNLI